jgi:hypothetical protein
VELVLSQNQMRAIEAHVTKHLGEFLVLHELIPHDLHIDILHVDPAKERNYHTLTTMGMSERAMAVPTKENDPKYAELMMCLPYSWKLSNQQDERNVWPLRWLQNMARFPDLAKTYLAPGHTIPNGDPPEPIGPGTKMCCMLIREPATVPESFRILQAGKKEIHFHAVVPIYEDEMSYKLSKGYKALDKLLRDHGVTELLDINRPSVCPPH